MKTPSLDRDATTPPRRRRRARSIRRLLGAAVLALAAVEALWLVFGNLYVRHRLLDVLNRKPERMQVAWSRAETWWPGVVSVRDLEIRKNGREIAWDARVDRARARISMLPLFFKRFTVSGLDASGLTVRVRFVHHEPARDDDAPRTSPDAPPVADLGTPAPPPPLPADRRRWTFRFEDASIDDVRELWIASFRLRPAPGEARIDTTMLVTPGRRLEIARFELEAGSAAELFVGDDLFVSGLTGRLACDLDPFAIAERRGVEILDELSARAELEGRLHDVQLPRTKFPGLPWLGFGGSTGAAEIVLALRDGALRDGSKLRVTAEHFEIAYPGDVVEGKAVVEGAVAGGLADLGATFDAFEIRREGAPRAHVRGEGFSARLRTEDTTLRKPLETFDLVLDLPESEIVDFDAYSDAIPKPLQMSIESGTGTIRGNLHATQDGGSGTLDVAARDVLMSYSGRTMSADFDIAGKIPQADMRAGEYDFSGTALRVRDGAIVHEGRKQVSDWWGDVALPGCLIHRGKPVAIELEADATLKDSRPLLALAFEGRGMLKVFQPALVATDVKVTGSFRGGPDLVDLDDLAMRGKGAVIRACVHLAGSDRRGVLMADGGMLSGGVTFAGGRRDVDVFAGEQWYERNAPLCEGGARSGQ